MYHVLCSMSYNFFLCLMYYLLCLMSYVLCLMSYCLMSYVLCLVSYVLYPLYVALVTCNMWHVTSDMSQVICDMWHETHPMWHMTCDMWHVTWDMYYVTCDMCTEVVLWSISMYFDILERNHLIFFLKWFAYALWGQMGFTFFTFSHIFKNIAVGANFAVFKDNFWTI